MPPRNANVRGGSPFASAMGPGAIEESLHCVSAMPIRPSPNAVSNNASITYEVAHELAKGEQASLAPPGSPLRDGSRSASPKRPPRGSPEARESAGRGGGAAKAADGMVAEGGVGEGEAPRAMPGAPPDGIFEV